MASIVSTILNDVVTAAVDFQVDKAELVAGALVKVGEIGSIEGKPIYMYLSDNPSAS
jgi:hypothetical protein